MTDKEIIKALENHIDDFNKNGISVDNNRLDKLTLDLINRQKAEIERLKGWENLLKAESHAPIVKKAKSEAIKEFAKRLKNSIYINTDLLVYQCEEVESMIDDIVKEMVGDTE